MKKNMGITDKVVRLVVVALITILYLTNNITGTAALILGALSVIFLLTSLVGFCPLYLPFGISTKKK